jgi:hypothetical protein
MTHVEPPPAIVRWTQRLEEATGLDGPVRALEPYIHQAFGSGQRGALLRGDWLGHALHPVMTDVVIGSWTSASVIDAIGGAGAAVPAQRLVATGLLAVGPTAWAGWAEWDRSGPREKRVGLVHAVTNGAAIGLYAASYAARRQGRHGAGARLALAGGAVLGVGGYLGSHLAQARKVGSRHPAYDTPLHAV